MNIQLEIPETFFRGEELCGYWVSPEIKRVWAVQLDLINEFARICGKHNIRWWMEAGTLLGAVRHKGFVPWDDDSDVVMMREDYERFLQVAPGELKYPHHLEPPEDGSKGRMTYYSRMFNEETAMFGGEAVRAIEAGRTSDMKYSMGICVDVSPIDDVPDDDDVFSSLYDEIIGMHHSIKRIAHFTGKYTPSPKLWKRPAKAALHYIMEKMNISPYKQFSKALDKMKSMRYPGSKRVVKICRIDDGDKQTFIRRCVWNRSDFYDTVYFPFETLRLPAPSGYDEVLKRFYGNWHRYVMRPRHASFFDTEHSYKYYTEEGHSLEEKDSI